MFQEVKVYFTNDFTREMVEWAYNKVREPDCHYMIEIHYEYNGCLEIYCIDGSKSPSDIILNPYVAGHDCYHYEPYDG